MINIVLFGPPGSGKGTQAKKIKEKYGLKHLSTGDLLRHEIKKKTKIGIEAKRLINDGNYVPDEMIIELIKCKISTQNKTGYILDGFPRTINQAKVLDDIFTEHETSLTKMISIDVNKKELIQRLILRAQESERPDDRNEKIIRRRLNIYEDVTSKVKKYYQNINKYCSINGNNNIDTVFSTICKEIEKINKHIL